MSTDISKTQPTIHENPSTARSGKTVDTKKSVQIPEVSEETDEEGRLEDTDASSDLSIGAQENILGIPRRRRKKKKNYWKREIELRSEFPEESEAVKTKSEEISGEQTESKIDTDTPKTFGETTSKENSLDLDSDHELKPSDLPISNPSDASKTIPSSEKFPMKEDDSRIVATRGRRKCRCCKCRDKLPTPHQPPGGEPECRVLLQVGMDSCTQTSIDRSDRCSQIEFDSKTTKGSCPGSKKSCSVRCNKELTSSFSTNPEKNCFCSFCNRMKSLEEDHFLQRGDNSPEMEDDHSYSQKTCSIPRRKTVGTVCKPQTRDQICYTIKPNAPNQEIYQCQRFRDNASSRKESDDSVSSIKESYRDRFDLPYQDNEEYKRLVRELEEKLVARNRERVRKTMREFEKCSTRNQNLSKPILYDESSCGEEPILAKIVHLKSGDTADKGRIHMSTPWNQSVAKGVNKTEAIPKTITPRRNRSSLGPQESCYDRDPTHWQMDTSTGEWYRVSDVDIHDPYDAYEPESRYSQPRQISRRRMFEYSEEELGCENCDNLNRRYGHRNNILYCPRHSLDRFPPRHRR